MKYIGIQEMIKNKFFMNNVMVNGEFCIMHELI